MEQTDADCLQEDALICRYAGDRGVHAQYDECRTLVNLAECDPLDKSIDGMTFACFYKDSFLRRP